MPFITRPVTLLLLNNRTGRGKMNTKRSRAYLQRLRRLVAQVRTQMPSLRLRIGLKGLRDKSFEEILDCTFVTATAKQPGHQKLCAQGKRLDEVFVSVSEPNASVSIVAMHVMFP
ncbi:hypothetical protein Poli38472_005094 [Pythium oligandrum]|uniref:Uncharacterized protein n=1 Tax=Pythium oligandrum TaxID=41045 RepID=A0A8K1FH95_PYTOL|nr:hypothetical protein Poli38472_005094 [Pythium oligandrum]|eukprot:TMW62476.1 hypothetical protein Poli38472_005094 [Pythium oligandrum]